MRKNLPVTNVETRVRADQYLISKTNTKGIITYANPAFIEISGYTHEELIGQPHNLIRHPDMPPEAFKDLWNTLHAGESWMGMVKNRRKDGGFYWVLANVTPIMEHGEVTGYASVRIRPSRAQIAQAEALYRRINEGTLSGYAISRGQLVPTGWRKLLKSLLTPLAPDLRARMLRMTLLSTSATLLATWFALTGGVPEDYRILIMATLAAAVTGTFAYGWSVFRRVIEPLQGVADIARQIAAGNLQVEIDTEQPGETGMLYFHIEMMRRSLIGIAHDVQASVRTTTLTAQTLDLDNRNLATRTEDQAAALQETAASVEQLTATVRQNADHAMLANQLSDNSMQIARRGGEVVNAVVHSMGRIHESSKQIGDIVALIESIAFQTNILALNAAVEAARAGEAGRGFAVVAAEVRNLAQKSGQAAKEIKQLIEESVARMQDGATEAERAGHTMQEIVEAVTKVTDLIGEISIASSEQTVGLEQINQAMTHLESATHENAQFGLQLGENIRLLASEAVALSRAIEVLNTGTEIIPGGTRRQDTDAHEDEMLDYEDNAHLAAPGTTDKIALIQ